MESGIRKIFVSEFGILGLGVWNRAQGIRNPTNDSNPESAGSIDKVFGRNPVPGIRNPWPGTGSDSHTFYGLVKGSSVFFCNIFSCYFCITRNLIYHNDFDIADPSSTQDACHTRTLYMAQLALRSSVVRASDRFNYWRGLIFFLSYVRDIRALGNSRFQYFRIR